MITIAVHAAPLSIYSKDKQSLVCPLVFLGFLEMFSLCVDLRIVFVSVCVVCVCVRVYVLCTCVYVYTYVLLGLVCD